MGSSPPLLPLLILLVAAPCLTQKLCSTDSITSKCEVDSGPTCGPVELDVNKVNSCPEKMVYIHIGRNVEKVGNDLECDRNTGNWMMADVNGTRTINVQRRGNVYCQYDECNKNTKLTPQCEIDDDECDTIHYAQHKLRCKRPATIGTRLNEDANWEILGATELDCKRGEYYYDEKPLPGGTQVGCRIKDLFDDGPILGLGGYIAIGAAALIILLAFLFWLILCKTGTGWISVIFHSKKSERTPSTKRYDFDANSRKSRKRANSTASPNRRSPVSPGVVSPLKQQPIDGETELKNTQEEAKNAPSTLPASRERITTEDFASKERVSEKIIRV